MKVIVVCGWVFNDLHTEQEHIFHVRMPLKIYCMEEG